MSDVNHEGSVTKGPQVELLLDRLHRVRPTCTQPCAILQIARPTSYSARPCRHDGEPTVPNKAAARDAVEQQRRKRGKRRRPPRAVAAEHRPRRRRASRSWAGGNASTPRLPRCLRRRRPSLLPPGGGGSCRLPRARRRRARHRLHEPPRRAPRHVRAQRSRDDVASKRGAWLWRCRPSRANAHALARFGTMSFAAAAAPAISWRDGRGRGVS
jgi:hypothetical protein